MDGEPFYLEQPLSNSNPNEINSQSISHTSNNNISNNNGKIIGNEVIQFQPSDLFDDLFNSDLKDKPKSNLNEKTITSSTLSTNDANNINSQDFSNIVYNSESDGRLTDGNNPQNVSDDGVIIEKS